jgi:hypothetical protein
MAVPVQRGFEESSDGPGCPADALGMVEVQGLDFAHDSGAERAVVFAQKKLFMIQSPLLWCWRSCRRNPRSYLRGARSMTVGSAITAKGGFASISIFTPATVGATLRWNSRSWRLR